MRAATVEISSKSIRKSSSRLGTKNAWAKYVRNRWRTNTLAMIQAEWDLTEGEARGVLYAQASQSTIDKIIDREDERRPFGGFRLGLVILEIRTQTQLEDFIVHQGQEAARESARWEAEQRRLAILEARVSGSHRLVGGADIQARPSRPVDAPLGAGTDGAPVEAKSFEPPERGRT